MKDDDTPLITPSDRKIIDNAVERLIEHFDSVQLFITKYETSSGKSAGMESGKGNWFARYGQVAEWVMTQEAGMGPKDP